MSAESSIKKTSIDRLSALPDAILCYILSFLETKDAAITCLLSRRWQFLWTESPGLRFNQDYGMEEICRFVNRVNRTLAICNRHNLEWFEVNFLFVDDYEKGYAFDVNAWIGFAVKNKVKHFILQLTDVWQCGHILPQMMYSDACWTSLILEGCVMAPRGTIRWHSLTTLWLERVELNENTFEKIFSGCPVLGSLGLAECWGFHRLEVSYRSLHTLVLADEFYGGHREISAPYLHALKILWRGRYKNLCLENMKSLVRAELEADISCKWEWQDPERFKKCIQDILGSILHVKMLSLGPRFIKSLSLIAWGSELPQSTAKCLELRVCSDKRIVPGIALLLESSPNLETLVIHGQEHHWDPSELVPACENDLNCDVLYLKTVYIKNFGDPNRGNGESLLTLARILLQRATILEKMVIDFRGFTARSSTAFYEMTQKLLRYPRVSEKAVVHFC